MRVPLPVAQPAEPPPPPPARRDPDGAQKERPARPPDHFDEVVREVNRIAASNKNVPPLPDHCPSGVEALGHPFLCLLQPPFLADLGGIIAVCAGFVLLWLIVLTCAGAPTNSIVVGLYVLCVALILGGVLLRFLVWKHSVRYWVCVGGVVWKIDDQIAFGTWADVRLYQRTVTIFQFNRTEYTCKLALADSPTFRISAQPPLFDFLQQLVLRALGPIYLERLAHGETVTLLPFRLTRDRLILDKAEIAWSDVRDVTVSDNRIRVAARRGTRPWAEVRLLSAPLATVFVPLAAGLAKQHAPPDARQPGEINPFNFG
jgi:hypothetical protein